jgi:hypothetical protein
LAPDSDGFDENGVHKNNENRKTSNIVIEIGMLMTPLLVLRARRARRGLKFRIQFQISLSHLRYLTHYRGHQGSSTPGDSSDLHAMDAGGAHHANRRAACSLREKTKKQEHYPLAMRLTRRPSASK